MDKKLLEKPENYYNREMSWLQFNYRILNEAKDKSIPLFERLNFLSITESNLSEFFMVRVASLIDLVHADVKKKDIAGLTPQGQLDLIIPETKNMIASQYSTLNRQILPAMEENGLKLVASNWIYGERHTLTTVPVNTVDDLKGLKIRVPSNEIQSKGFDVLGATSTGMALGDVYQALQTKTIDGAENPLATLYGRKLHEVAKYLILDGHVKNFTTWVVSADWFHSLTDEQQGWVLDSFKEAVDGVDEWFVEQLKDAGYKDGQELVELFEK